MTARPPTAEHAARIRVLPSQLRSRYSFGPDDFPLLHQAADAIDALLADLEAAQAERDDAIHGRELARLNTENERKHHKVTRAELDETQRFAGVQHARAVAAESALAAAREALARIAEQQPRTLEKLRAHGVVFDGPLGADPKNFQHVAFSIYTDLCEVDSIARTALADGKSC